MNALSEVDVVAWLGDYKRAWEEQDSDRIVTLFTDDAQYIETPFRQPMVGTQEIRRYWDEEVVTAQKDITFNSRFWHLEGNIAVAHWQAQFFWLRTGRPGRLDGVFRLYFRTQPNDPPLCEKLEEWWVLEEGQTPAI